MTASERRRGAAGAGLLVAGGALAGCGGGVLAPAGREASRIAAVWWLMFSLAAVVFVAVLVALVLAVRTRPEDTPARRLGSTRAIVLGGIAVPSVVLMLLLGLTLWAGGDVRREGADGAVPIEVTGHQYWWDVRYPDAGVRTANEIHVPVGQEVLLSLESDDVIHSVWIPQLAGKIDLIPGRTNRMTVRVDEPGVYEGVCAEFCGIQHARMRLEVVAHEPAAFDDWLERSSRPIAVPDDEQLFEGWQTFMSSACVYCHNIEGTPAASEFGPDLTNLASRRTLAAGILDNTRGELAGWIVDPQRAKPGNHMPATWYEPEQLQSLLDFLESLE